MVINKNSIISKKVVENILTFHNSRCLWFTFDELLEFNNFNKNIIKSMSAKKQYCVLLKVRYLDDNYAMLVFQIPFKFNTYWIKIKYN